MPNQDSEIRTEQAPDARQQDIWQPVDGSPPNHVKAAKAMREIANLSQKRDGIINDLCESMKTAMEADSKEESVDIVKSSFDMTASSQTQMFHSSRLFFVLQNVMRILGFAVREGKTIIPHVMNLLFEPGCPELEDALAMYRNYRALVSLTAQPAARVFREQDPHDTGSETGVLRHITLPAPHAAEIRPQAMPPLNIGHRYPIQKFSPRPQPRPKGLNFSGAEAASSPRFRPHPIPQHDLPPNAHRPQVPVSRDNAKLQASRIKQYPAMLVKDMPKLSGTPCGIIPLQPGLGGEAEATAKEHAARREARLQPFGRAREKRVSHWPITRSRPVVHLREGPVTE